MGLESVVSFSFSGLKSRQGIQWAIAYFLVHLAALFAILVLLLALLTPLVHAFGPLFNRSMGAEPLSDAESLALGQMVVDYVSQHLASIVIFGIGALALLLIAFVVSVWLELNMIRVALLHAGQSTVVVDGSLTVRAILAGIVATLRALFWPFSPKLRLILWAGLLSTVLGGILFWWGVTHQHIVLLIFSALWLLPLLCTPRAHCRRWVPPR